MRSYLFWEIVWRLGYNAGKGDVNPEVLIDAPVNVKYYLTFPVS